MDAGTPFRHSEKLDTKPVEFPGVIDSFYSFSGDRKSTLDDVGKDCSKMTYDLPRLQRRLVTLSRWQKVTLMVLADCIGLPLAFFATMWILVPDARRALQARDAMYLLVPLATIGVFALCGLYKAVLRFIDKHLLLRSGGALALLAAFFSIAAHAAGNGTFARNVPVVYWFVAFSYIVSSRMAVRSFLRPDMMRRNGGPQPVGIFGAGEAGAQLAAALRTEGKYRPVCFFDDKHELNNRSIAGLRVFHSSKLRETVRQLDIGLVILALPDAPTRRRLCIIQSIREAGVAAKTLGALVDLTDEKAPAGLVRDLRIEDLLGRRPVPPVPSLFGQCIRGKTVLVTGAGGSIGSELCRQIMSVGPRRLHLLEHSEFALYSIEQELRASYPRADIRVHLGSVCVEPVVASTLGAERVDTVYHAAAYKHVPIVEGNAIEGIRNNVIGTRVIADASIKYGVGTCVLISTDKAVRPTNIMGASKRISELIFQAAAQCAGGRTRFSMVRLGNVLASSGSVIPAFQRQIESGGPLTITHPDIIRYFMLIPEAAQLVIQAGAMAKGGDLFVLDMGDPVRILDLARTMLQMAGLREKDQQNPDGDIEIRFIGLRPGEKLYEELLIGENTFPTSHPRILGARENCIHYMLLDHMVRRLIAVCASNDLQRIKMAVKSIVSEYQIRTEETPAAHKAVSEPVFRYRRHRMASGYVGALQFSPVRPRGIARQQAAGRMPPARQAVEERQHKRVMVVGGVPGSLLYFRGHLLKRLVSSGSQVHATAAGLLHDEGICAALRGMQCTCHEIELSRNGLNPVRDIGTLVRLTWLMWRVRPTHFLGYTIKPVIYGLLAARWARVQNRTALITGLGSAFTGAGSAKARVLQYIVRSLYRFALRNATCVVFQNPDDREVFVHLGLVGVERTALVNGSGVPLDEYAQQPLPKQDQIHFLLIGRLIRDKGVYDYVEAARRIKERYPQAVFHLVGWIDSNPTAIRRADLDEWLAKGLVRYHGQLADVTGILTESHVFVLPSHRGEGTPRSVLEAMATGRAVITTDAPGCRETVIDGHNGFLVPVGDAAALAHAMERFLLQPELAAHMGLRSRRIAEEKYDVDKVNAEMLLHMGLLPESTAPSAVPGTERREQAVA
ncbi:glycosyltransferase [Oxalobacteraceae bacterium OM1]|nr:glycosyltransferase [Oxalobacteraceae bacterium OM1]